MEELYWSLTWRILLPIIVLSALILCVLKKFFRKKESWKSIAMLNPDHGLGKQMLFWLVIVTPIVYFLEFGILAWQGYSPALNRAGFDEFMSISKLPIALLSLSVLLAALVAKLHSTSQTAKQIGLTTSQIALSNLQVELTTLKNNHDLFYLHRREYVSYYGQIATTPYENGMEVSFDINPRVHERVFEGAAVSGTPILRKIVMDGLIQKVISARRNLIDLIAGTASRNADKRYVDFCRDINYLIGFFVIMDVVKAMKGKVVLLNYVEGDIVGSCTSAGLTTLDARSIFSCVEDYLIATLDFSGYREGLNDLGVNRSELRMVAKRHPNSDVIEAVIRNFEPGTPIEL